MDPSSGCAWEGYLNHKPSSHPNTLDNQLLLFLKGLDKNKVSTQQFHIANNNYHQSTRHKQLRTNTTLTLRPFIRTLSLKINHCRQTFRVLMISKTPRLIITCTRYLRGSLLSFSQTEVVKHKWLITCYQQICSIYNFNIRDVMLSSLMYQQLSKVNMILILLSSLKFTTSKPYLRMFRLLRTSYKIL